MNEAALSGFFAKRKIVLFDSAMGTALLAAGQPAGTGSEEMNVSAPAKVFRIHMENIMAGSDVITSNSFGVSQMLLRGEKVKGTDLLTESLTIMKRAVDTGAVHRKRVLGCLGIGPTGALLGPMGDVSYETAEDIFSSIAEEGARGGAEFILLETFADLEEFTRAAWAAKKASGLPVLGTMTFGEGGRSFMGAAAADYVREARACGLFAIGANCTLGPLEITPIIESIIDMADGLPVIAQPNAGQPVYKDGQTVYEIETEDFAAGAKKLIDAGVSAIGGCCGTTPEMISAVRGIIDSRRNH
jgi:Methionine synthase I (cobalamin-dependent), methyltransferase domain